MKRSSWPMLVIAFSLAFAASGSIQASAPPPPQSAAQAALSALKQAAGDSLNVEWSGGISSVPTFVTGRIQAGQVAPEQAARQFFAKYGALYAMRDQAQELTLAHVDRDDLNMQHIRFDQTVNGVPVFGAEMIVHLRGDEITAVNGEYVPNISVNVTPDLSKNEALAIARNDLGDSQAEFHGNYSELAVYARGNLPPTLTWQVNIFSHNPLGNWLYFVNAHDGSVVHKFNQLDTARNRQIYTANYLNDLPGTLMCEESGSGCASDTDAWDAYTYTGDTYDYYNATFGRDSFDGAGATMIASVHLGSSVNNAYWDGTQTAFGDGDGVNFSGFARERDVVAHEWTHAVTQYAANLIYEWQSGALNESYSDVFGEMIERYATGTGPDWKNGDVIYTPYTAGDAMRDLANPSNGVAGTFDPSDPVGSDGQPDHMSIYAANLPLYLDNGGVHINSGVPNKAAYLISQGGFFHGVAVTGVGTAKMEQFYYRALTQYLIPSSDFYSARNATIQACTDLIGQSYGGSQVTSADCDSVRNGFAAVGIGLPAGSVHSIYLPVVLNGTACAANSIYGRVTVGGAAASGVSLALRRCSYGTSGCTWSTQATVTTNSQGCYSFTGIPGVSGSSYYYVQYTNPNTSSSGGRVYSWWGNRIYDYTAGSAVAKGDFDIADIVLSSPNTTSPLYFPVTFSWTRRSATELYRLNVWDPSSGSAKFWTSPIYGMNNYTLESLPSGLYPNTQYYWEIYPYSRGGYGESYWSYGVKFATYMLSGLPQTVESAERIPAWKIHGLSTDLPFH